MTGKTSDYSRVPASDPPPYYDATNDGASSARYGTAQNEHEEPLLRNSMDNIPDDFKTTVSDASVNIRMAFVRKVYGILAAQLMLTVIISSVSFFSKPFQKFLHENTWMMITCAILSFVFLFLTMWKSRSYPLNLVFLGTFTALEAYTIAVVVSYYQTSIVLRALFITLGIFIALTLFACQTKYDFSGWEPYLFTALCGVVIVGFVGIFLPFGSTMELVYSAGIALLFSAYILFDTQMLIQRRNVDEEIPAALDLYLDVINLFLAILRILNSQNDN